MESAGTFEVDLQPLHTLAPELATLRIEAINATGADSSATVLVQAPHSATNGTLDGRQDKRWPPAAMLPVRAFPLIGPDRRGGGRFIIMAMAYPVAMEMPR